MREAVALVVNNINTKVEMVEGELKKKEMLEKGKSGCGFDGERLGRWRC